MWDYTEKVKEHFFHPRNVGEIENPDGVGEVGSLACGDALKLTFKLDEKGTDRGCQIQDVRLRQRNRLKLGPYRNCQRHDDRRGLKVTNKDIADFLGGLPEQKMHCSVMGREALEAAIENYRGGGKIKHELSGRVVCTCFGVTEDEIVRVIKENDLTAVEQVTNYCKAGGGCGGCKGEIEKLILQVQGDKIKTVPPPVRKGVKLTNIQKIQLVQQTIDEQIRPALRADGGDIELDRYRRQYRYRRISRHVCPVQNGRSDDEGCRAGEAPRIRLR